MKIYISGNLKLMPFKGEFMVFYDLDFTVDLKLFTIPHGMLTDLGSIPRPFRNIFSSFGRGTTAFVIHDFGYRTQPKNTTRKFWDQVLLKILKDKKEKKWKIKTIYRAVRIFGWIAWKKNSRFVIHE